jgi:hypothetical protein
MDERIAIWGGIFNVFSRCIAVKNHDPDTLLSTKYKKLRRQPRIVFIAD